MATVGEWNRLINVEHNLALIEYDLRETAATGNQRASVFASRLLWDRFGVDVTPKSE